MQRFDRDTERCILVMHNFRANAIGSAECKAGSVKRSRAANLRKPRLLILTAELGTKLRADVFSRHAEPPIQPRKRNTHQLAPRDIPPMDSCVCRLDYGLAYL